MFNYEKAQQTNEKLKALLLERGIKVADNRTTEELEQNLLRCCQQLGIKLQSPAAKILQKKYKLSL